MKLAYLTIEGLKNWLKGMSEEEIVKVLPSLGQDPRQGVQKLIKSWERKLNRREKEIAKWKDLCRWENQLRGKGFHYVAGIDEAGRGPLAGPVVAAAVILKIDNPLRGLDDSKKLSPQHREDLYKQITSTAVTWAIGSSNARYIDTTNILQATQMAMTKAYNKLTVPPDYLLLDAMKLPGIKAPQEGVVGGDGRCACIAAASVLAKVTRDRWMKKWDQYYPGYGFAKHKGYPTPEHLQALAKLGPSPLHRLSFRPLANFAPGKGNITTRG